MAELLKKVVAVELLFEEVLLKAFGFFASSLEIGDMILSYLVGVVAKFIFGNEKFLFIF